MGLIGLRGWVYFAALSFVVVFGFQAVLIYRDAVSRGVPRGTAGVLGTATLVMPYVSLPLYLVQYGKLNNKNSTSLGFRFVICLSISLIVSSLISPFVFSNRFNSIQVQGMLFIPLAIPVYVVLFKLLGFDLQQPQN